MKLKNKKDYIAAATQLLKDLGFPRAQQNERSALCLLALLNLKPGKTFAESENPLLGITPVMDWVKLHYKKVYAPNSRETFRRQTMHQFCDAGIVLYNPDEPNRPVNSPNAVYQIEKQVLELIRDYGSQTWDQKLKEYLSINVTLIARYAKERNLKLVPVKISDEKEIKLSSGEHSELIRSIIEEFAPRFAPGSLLVYAGDTGDKWGYFDQTLLTQLGLDLDQHGKMPDVVLYCAARNWLLLVESVTSHGPVDGKRFEELSALFEASSAGLVYVTAFQSRAIMGRYLSEIAWETEVWVADAPTHLIHFNGDRFLGPYTSP